MTNEVYSSSSVQAHNSSSMPQPGSAFRLTAAPIANVRIALIGLGERGMRTLERYADISGAEIRCIVDLEMARLEEANKKLQNSGRSAADCICGREAWREACRKTDIDLIYICTEWRTHTPMAVYAMECGKHVAVEVPAATTIAECWQLVETAERTKRHCFMTENCCYDAFALQTLELHRQGLLGTITHCEGAYIHNLRSFPNSDKGKTGISDTRKNWMERSCETHGGNPYPTHGIGPIAQLLAFHRGDHMKSIVSVTARGEQINGELLGRVNSSLIQTERGVSILLQLDVTTPRPYSRSQMVCGTQGFIQKYPLPMVQLADNAPLTGEEAVRYMQRFATSEASRLWNEGHYRQVRNEMNYAMDARLIYCLNHGLPLDIDVYDAAEWSCLAELSQRSAQQGGLPQEIPNFMERKA